MSDTSSSAKQNLSGRKGFSKLLFCLIIVSQISCRQQKVENDNVITYWSANNQYEQNLAKAVVAEWNQLHPESPVHFQPVPEGQSSEEVILAAVVGKSPPDVYSNMWPGDVQLYVNAKALVPLSDFADFDSVMNSRMKKDILEEARSKDGKVYQVPWKTNPVMLCYNKKIFRKYGFEKPGRTYSEFIRQAKVITADLDGDGYTDQYMGARDIRALWWQRFFDYYTLYIAASSGKTLLHDNHASFDNQASIEVFNFLKTMFHKGYFPLEKMMGRGDLFLSGRTATRFAGPWVISHNEKLKPKGFEYDFVALPVPDSLTGPVYTYGDFKNIVMFKTKHDPQNAWKFVKFMISRKNDYRLLKIASQLPLRKNILNDSLYADYFKQNPKVVSFAQQAKFVKGVDISKNMKEVFDIISKEYEACVVYSAKSSESAIHDAAERVNLILR